jgi:hypothetical protein
MLNLLRNLWEFGCTHRHHSLPMMGKEQCFSCPAFRFNDGKRISQWFARKYVRVGVMVLLAIGLANCGGGFMGTNQAATTNSADIKGRWVNRTSLPNGSAEGLFEFKLAQARMEWEKPQVNLYGEPTRELTFQEKSCLQSVEPHGWVIVGLKSVPAAELNTLKDCKHCPYVDPTPFVYCPDNPTFKYCNAYLHDGAINIPDAFPDFVGPWEMQNKQLEACHVDIGAR